MSYPPENLKVMITDDHFLFRQILINMLHSKKVTQIDTAADGQVARDMINRAQSEHRGYDIVFLDWEMPVMLGIDVLKYFREQPSFDRTAFVMVTAVQTHAQVKEAIRAGATAYITKPIAPAALAKKFDEVMRWVSEKKQAK